MVTKGEKQLPRSEEWCRHISEARKGKFVGVNASFYGKHLSGEAKQQLREKALTPERIIISKRNLPKYKKGEGPQLGVPHTLDVCRKISEAHKGQVFSEERKEAIRNRLLIKGHPMLGKHHSPETKAKLSEQRKAWWRIPKNREKGRQASIKFWQDIETARRILKSQKRTPNASELRLESYITLACPHEYKYVGDGQIIIGRMTPDFANCNGQKKVIEMFGTYWHKGENPQDRIDKFAEFGFNCLVIWEHELKEKSEEELVGIIKKFNKQGVVK